MATGVIGVAAECDAAAIPVLLDRLQSETAEAGPASQFQLELEPGRPTAIALQLLLSAAATLRRRDGFAGFGPRAAATLGAQRQIGS